MFVSKGVRRWRVRAGARSELSGILVILAASRTRLGPATLHIGGDDPVSLQPRGRRVLEARWSGTRRRIESGEALELSLGYEGDVPQIARVLWIARKSDHAPGWLLPHHVLAPDDVPDDPRLRGLVERERRRLAARTRVIESDEVDGLVAEVAGVDDRLFELRRQALQADGRVREFFLAVDERTDPRLNAEAWGDRMIDVSYRLFRRIQVRAAYGLGGKTPRFDSLDEALDAKTLTGLREVSALFGDLTAEHLEIDGGDLFDWAFNQFAIDRAAVYHHDPSVHEEIQVHGAPNGSEFFKFVELAFACWDNDIDRDFWQARLEALTRAAHAFTEHAREPAEDSAVMDKPNSYGFEPGRHYPYGRRAELLADYAAALEGKSEEERRVILEDRFTSLLAQALRDIRVGSPGAGGRPLDEANRVEVRWPDPGEAPDVEVL